MTSKLRGAIIDKEFEVEFKFEKLLMTEKVKL